MLICVVPRFITDDKMSEITFICVSLDLSPANKQSCELKVASLLENNNYLRYANQVIRQRKCGWIFQNNLLLSTLIVLIRVTGTLEPISGDAMDRSGSQSQGTYREQLLGNEAGRKQSNHRKPTTQEEEFSNWDFNFAWLPGSC